MSLGRPALEVLGVSPAFVREHSKELIIAVADSVYRVAMGKYHPDKKDEALPVPENVNLTDIQFARDAVRADVDACIRDLLNRVERVSRETRQIDNLSRQKEELRMRLSLRDDALGELWDHIARGKLGLDKGEEQMADDRMSYGVGNLNGLAILVSDDAGSYLEYICDKGFWFSRQLKKIRVSRIHPCPPGVPEELRVVPVGGGSQGFFYDQDCPHAPLIGFEIIGSYTRRDLAAERARRGLNGSESRAKTTLPGARVAGELMKKIEPSLTIVLKPRVVTGRILFSAMRGEDGSMSYKDLGGIVGVRIFDARQRTSRY